MSDPQVSLSLRHFSAAPASPEGVAPPQSPARRGAYCNNVAVGGWAPSMRQGALPEDCVVEVGGTHERGTHEVGADGGDGGGVVEGGVVVAVGCGDAAASASSTSPMSPSVSVSASAAAGGGSNSKERRTAYLAFLASMHGDDMLRGEKKEGGRGERGSC